MSVGQDDLGFHRSATGSSDGGATTGVPYSNAKGAFWPNIPDVDRLAGGTDTKKWFLHNGAALYGLISPSIWIQQEPTFLTEEIGLGFDHSDDSDPDQGNMTAWSTNAVVSVRSSSSDTREATIWGLDDTGTPMFEAVTLNGTSEVLSLATWSVVYAVRVDAINAALIVTVKEGAGGTTRGTIPANKLCCWLWIEALDKGSGIHLPDLAPLDSYGFWDRITWPAATSGVRPNNSVIAVEEN